MKNASSEEICRRQAFARILSWQYFRLFQQYRPFCDVRRGSEKVRLLGWSTSKAALLTDAVEKGLEEPNEQ